MQTPRPIKGCGMGLPCVPQESSIRPFVHARWLLGDCASLLRSDLDDSFTDSEPTDRPTRIITCLVDQSAVGDDTEGSNAIPKTISEAPMVTTPVEAPHGVLLNQLLLKARIILFVLLLYKKG